MCWLEHLLRDKEVRERESQHRCVEREKKKKVMSRKTQKVEEERVELK